MAPFTYVPTAVYPLIAAVGAGCSCTCYIIGRKLGYDPDVSVYKSRRLEPIKSDLQGDDARSKLFKGSSLFDAIAKINPPAYFGPGELAARKETM